MRVVLCNGVFDPCHPGHLEHFYQAKRFGDFLIVSVTDDENVRRERGGGRPMFNQELRSGFLRAIAIVDRVIIVKGLMDALWTVRPYVLAKGPDYVGKIEERHARFCRENNIQIRFTDGPKWSATAVVDELRRC